MKLRRIAAGLLIGMTVVGVGVFGIKEGNSKSVKSIYKETDAERALEIIGAEKDSVIYIGKASCPPCQEFKPVLEEVKTKREIYFIDLDKEKDKEKTQKLAEAAQELLDEKVDRIPLLIKIEDKKGIKYKGEVDRAEIEKFLK